MISSMFDRAYKQNTQNILSLLHTDKKAKIIDLGCDDGQLAKKIAARIKSTDIYGVDLVKKRLMLAAKNGVKVKKVNLNGRFPFPSGSFDVVHTNQVIEHIVNVDMFVSEIMRILKPGGYAIISTENASSWHNIIASIFGWQIFSLTNFSTTIQSFGNPLALHKQHANKKKAANNYSSTLTWNHVRILNFFGLKEYLERSGFSIEKIYGSGYYPFPAIVGNIDKIHAHFITFKCIKPFNKL